MKIIDCIVIGGGPAGMTAAITAARYGNDVLLIEQNEKLGKKIYITGKGRCNVCNFAGLSEFLNNVPTNNKFLYSTISNFLYDDVVEFFAEAGIKLKVERGGRVFPASDKSSDVIKAFEFLLKKYNVNVVLNTKVTSIKKQDDIFSVNNLTARSVIIATGGVSYPLTGSTGDGYKLAKNFGLSVIEPKAALVPIKLKETVTELEGLALKNVTVSIGKPNSRPNYISGIGEMLFTYEGVSGPLILSASSYITKLENLSELKLAIDLKPALNEKELDERLLRDFKEFNNKDFKNYVGELLPKSLISYFIARTKIDGNKKINQISSEERKTILKLLKYFDFSIKELYNINEAIITSGGVSTLELNPKTLEVKTISGLYFAGEVVDVDALTGGFNIQIAMSQGRAAGLNIK